MFKAGEEYMEKCPNCQLDLAEVGDAKVCTKIGCGFRYSPKSKANWSVGKSQVDPVENKEKAA